MSILQHITLTQFKNHGQARFDLHSRVTGIFGMNGTGKTNLLDAMYYACFTRGYFLRNDTDHIQTGHDGFRIEARFTQPSESWLVVCKVHPPSRKEFSVNGTPYARLAEHIGRFPAVMVAPDDTEMVRGSSEGRRRYLDTLMCQIDRDYLYTLGQYTSLLKQRNALLKRWIEQGKDSVGLLEALDAQLIPAGEFLFQKRKSFADTLLPLARKQYEGLSEGAEPVTLSYVSPLAEGSFADLLRSARPRDILLQRSTVGVHRDDIDIQLQGLSFRDTASQGQRKSMLFALKLAEIDVLLSANGTPPLLLLDDIFEKLDERRMQQLIRRVCVDNPGQVVLTDTHAERLESTIRGLGADYAMIGL